MAGDGNFTDIKEVISSALVATTRAAGQCANEDIAFQRSLNPAVAPLLEQQSSRLLQLARRLARAAASGTDIPVPQLSNLETVEDNWKGLVDVFDNLLEKTDACLDEYTGVIRKLSPAQEEKIKQALPSGSGNKRPGRAFRTQNITKPQLLFPHVPTNNESTPFKPLLASKPHAIMPLEESLSLAPSKDGLTQYSHPYETEIKQSQYPPATYMTSDPIPYLPYETTQATLVDTTESMMSMLEELKLAKEIAVDLEHHDEHSYVGLVSLMQISTRNKDWIIDTLKPWRQELQILNEVFTDPKILKVFHGAAMDIIWLQRDLGLYVVGLFDTFHASRVLGYPRNSLAYLLKHFCDFDAAKQYQMADWRIRPLPDEMFSYARSDTHFLLYIYDHMRNELVEKSNTASPGLNLIHVVMKNSKEETLQRYERPVYDSQRGLGAIGWYNMLRRTPALFNREQFAVFKAVHQWRDGVARQEDESVHHVMPKSVLYNIAREMPVDMPSLIGCSHPMSKVFHRRKQELLSVIRKAKILGTTGPEMKDEMKVLDRITRIVYTDPTTMNGMDRAAAHFAIAREEEQTTQPLMPNEFLARAYNSSFWGSTIRNPLENRQKSRLEPNDRSLSLALPLPQLTAAIFESHKATDIAALEVPLTHPSARAEHPYIKDRGVKEDDVFSVKQAGGSRKRKVANMTDPPETVSPIIEEVLIGEVDEKTSEIDSLPLEGNANRQVGVNNQLEVNAEQKRLERREKKRLKRERSLHETNSTARREESGQVEAFDYANAPSLLRVPREDGNGMRGGVNPYAKSLDVPKGMRKMKKEIGGKSLTFKA